MSICLELKCNQVAISNIASLVLVKIDQMMKPHLT